MTAFPLEVTASEPRVPDVLVALGRTDTAKKLKESARVR